jgi:hypothetical protein
MALDPLTEMHRAVWAALEASGDFKNLVPERNRIKFRDTTKPESLLQRAEADTPAVFLQLAHVQLATVIASNTIAAVASFQVQAITTGQDQQPVQQLMWVIAKAIEDANLQLPPNIVAMRFRGGEIRQERISQRLTMNGLGTITVQYATAWRSTT